jgi:hypothetical protein
MSYRVQLIQNKPRISHYFITPGGKHQLAKLISTGYPEDIVVY